MEVQRIKTSEEDRLLVSGFMGEEYPVEVDFNWLMPVVEKIEKLGYPISMQPHGCQIYDKGDSMIIDADFNWTRLENAWDGIVSFIKWYNNQTPSP